MTNIACFSGGEASGSCKGWSCECESNEENPNTYDFDVRLGLTTDRP